MVSEVILIRSKIKEYSKEEGVLNKFHKALDKAGIKDIIDEGNIVAVKIHIGDLKGGGYRYIKPVFVRRLVDKIRDVGGEPFVTDTWGLRHILAGIKNGFNYTTLNAPVIPANGIRENYFVSVKLERYFRLREVQVAGNIYDAEVLINFAHAKGHPSSAYGGALKNIAMGCTSYKTRGLIHALEKEDKTGERFQEAMIDVVAGVLENKRNKALHINYIMDVSENCDCAPWSNNPLIPDIGIAISRDPVALDTATLDLINEAPPIPYSIADEKELPQGSNKFKIIHGKDPYIQVYKAEEAGLGETKYRIIEF